MRQRIEHVGGVHVVAPEVVGDAVERVRGLVALVAPVVELAVESVGGREVEHDGALRCGIAGGKLQEQPDEVGYRESRSLGERLRTGEVGVGDPHVDSPRVALHATPIFPTGEKARESQRRGASPAWRSVAGAHVDVRLSLRIGAARPLIRFAGIRGEPDADKRCLGRVRTKQAAC